MNGYHMVIRYGCGSLGIIVKACDTDSSIYSRSKGALAESKENTSLLDAALKRHR